MKRALCVCIGVLLCVTVPSAQLPDPGRRGVWVSGGAGGGTGDITSVVAGAGMTGGGTEGDVTLNVIGTADKITVNANDVTIASTYVGQTSITTLGTVATGTWNGTAVTVAYGGTGATSLTDGGVLLGSGTGAVTAMSALADSEMIVGNGSTDPVAESGATLRTSIGVGTGDSPQFTGLTISGTGASSLDVGGGINVGTGDVALVTATGKITALSGTYLDDLSGAALTTLNASNISSGTLANARLPTNVDLGGTLDVTGVTTLDSTMSVAGIVGIGGAPDTYAAVTLRTAFTSSGDSSVARGLDTDRMTVTGVSGDTTHVLGSLFSAAMTVQDVSETVTDVAQVMIDEPAITKGAAATITNSSSLKITGAASEATNNYALWVDAGVSRFDGNVDPLEVVDAATSGGTLDVLKLTTSSTNDIAPRFLMESNRNSVSQQAALVIEASTGAGAKLRLQTDNTSGALVDALAIDSSQNVGVGVTDPGVELEVSGGSNKLDIFRVTQRVSGAGAYGLQIGLDPSPGDPVFSRLVNGTATEALRIQRSTGYIGIGAVPYSHLHVSDGSLHGNIHSGGSSAVLGSLFNHQTTASGYLNITQLNNSGGVNARINLGFGVIASNVPTNTVMTLNQDGGVGIGVVPGGGEAKLHVNTTGNQVGFEVTQNVGGEIGVRINGGALAGAHALAIRNSTPAVTFSVTDAGAVTKTSSTFRIDHPLPAKSDTHHLVHSALEGPRADLLYRGDVELEDGTATVNLDDAAGMTAGTWALLCRDPQVFVSNETGWSAVRGSVDGHLLTIASENTSSTATVNWMVVAERQDDNIKAAGWTDEDGHPILEPEQPVEDAE